MGHSCDRLCEAWQVLGKYFVVLLQIFFRCVPGEPGGAGPVRGAVPRAGRGCAGGGAAGRPGARHRARHRGHRHQVQRVPRVTIHVSRLELRAKVHTKLRNHGEGAFDQEKALVGAFSVIVKSSRRLFNLRLKIYS